MLSRLLCGLLLLTGLPALAGAEDAFPKGFIVAPDSTSPDGRFGVLIPGKEESEGDPKNYLANLKTRHLEEIDDADYWEDRGHAELLVSWAADSSFCVVEMEDRSEYTVLTVLEPKEGGMVQTELGEFLRKKLNAVTRKASRGKAPSCSCYAWYRADSSRRQVQLRALACTNPRDREGVRDFAALVEGTYDLRQKRWTTLKTRPVPEEQHRSLPAVIGPPNFDDGSYGSDELRAEALDRQLNEVYRGVRFLLSAERFAPVKQAQLAWLKQRNAAAPVTEKIAELKARIVALQALLW